MSSFQQQVITVLKYTSNSEQTAACEGGEKKDTQGKLLDPILQRQDLCYA